MDFHDLDIRTTEFWRIWFSLTLFIFCSPLELRAQSVAPVLVGAGDIATCDGDKSEETAKLIDKIEGRVFTVADHAYAKGKVSEFLKCYDPTWGRHLKRTHPTPGNHDYGSSYAGPYFEYFRGNAGPVGRGYYSYNLGAWHIIALNSNPNARFWGAAQELADKRFDGKPRDLHSRLLASPTLQLQ